MLAFERVVPLELLSHRQSIIIYPFDEDSIRFAYDVCVILALIIRQLYYQFDLFQLKSGDTVDDLVEIEKKLAVIQYLW